MKAGVSNIGQNKRWIEPFHFRIQDTHDKVEIVDYTDENGGLIITLFSLLFNEDNFRFFLHENKLVIVITEKVQSARQELPVVDWHRFHGSTYERLRNVSIYLPGDNFYLLRHIVIPEKFLLKVILGQVKDN